MKLLLDTHVIVWWLSDPSRLSSETGAAVREEHALASLSLPPLHGDPFDRILIAQAQSEKMTLVTSDEIIPSYGVPVLKA